MKSLFKGLSIGAIAIYIFAFGSLNASANSVDVVDRTISFTHSSKAVNVVIMSSPGGIVTPSDE